MQTRRYTDLNTYLREHFGERVQKISLDAGLGCPNRDGTLSSRGCVYCDSRGSGTGAWIERKETLNEQIQHARAFLQRRYKARKFIAYFQSFSNTYAPLPRLKELYETALSHEDVVGLSVSTRPDCLDDDVMGLLASYQKRKRLVWLELGLQSAHDATLARINRGHTVADFDNAVHRAHDHGLKVCAHIILGLPGEDRHMMLETAHHLRALPLHGVKIHLLYVVRGTVLAGWFEKGLFRCLEREEYANLAVDFLERLPQAMVIHRLTGDPVRSELVAPKWSLEKSRNLMTIEAAFERRDTYQGRCLNASERKLPDI